MIVKYQKYNEKIINMNNIIKMVLKQIVVRKCHLKLSQKREQHPSFKYKIIVRHINVIKYIIIYSV